MKCFQNYTEKNVSHKTNYFNNIEGFFTIKNRAQANDFLKQSIKPISLNRFVSFEMRRLNKIFDRIRKMRLRLLNPVIVIYKMVSSHLWW